MKHYFIRLMGVLIATFACLNRAKATTGYCHSLTMFDEGGLMASSTAKEVAKYTLTTGNIWMVAWPNAKYTGDKKLWCDYYEPFGKNYKVTAPTVYGSGETGVWYTHALIQPNAIQDPEGYRLCFSPSYPYKQHQSGLAVHSCLTDGWSDSLSKSMGQALYAVKNSNIFLYYGCCFQETTDSTGTSGASGYDVNTNCPCFYGTAASGVKYTGNDGVDYITQRLVPAVYVYEFINCQSGLYQPYYSGSLCAEISEAAPAKGCDGESMYYDTGLAFMGSPDLIHYGSNLEKLAPCMIPMYVRPFNSSEFACTSIPCLDSENNLNNMSKVQYAYHPGSCWYCPTGAADTNLGLDDEFKFAPTVGVESGTGIVAPDPTWTGAVVAMRSTFKISSCHLENIYGNGSYGTFSYQCDSSYEE